MIYSICEDVYRLYENTMPFLFIRDLSIHRFGYCGSGGWSSQNQFPTDTGDDYIYKRLVHTK